MSVYESIETYAEFTHMSLEQAKIRYEHFAEIKKQMHESRKCPKCQKHTLAVESGEWESGVSDWIYCENEDECDFTDDVKKEYLFAFEVDFDVILYFACQLEHSNLEQLEREIGLNWNDFIEKEMADIQR